MHLPGPLRAAVGFVASAAEEAKHLPDRAIELPMLAVSTALQVSLRAQQRYARLAARGDEVLNRRPATDEPPEWATFDEPVSVDELRRATLAQLDDLGPDSAASQVLDELLGGSDPDQHVNGSTPPPEAAEKPPAAKPAAKQTAPAAKQAPVKKTPAKKAPAKKAPAKTAAAKKSAPVKNGNGGKSVSKPRHTAPSRFDDVGDDAE